MAFKHGVYTSETATSVLLNNGTKVGSANTDAGTLQVVVGTAPVNMVEDAPVNIPVLVKSFTDAKKRLGFCADFSYTLCQSMYANEYIYNQYPVVYINVLDPAKHKKTLTETEADVVMLEAKVEKTGIIKDGLTVKAGETTLEEGTDYLLSFDDNGYLVVSLVPSGTNANAAKISVSGSVLDPSAVTAAEIVGEYDTDTGAVSGIQTIKNVYPMFNRVPDLLLAPDYSKNKTVGAALSAAALSINGSFKALALLDLDTSEAKKYTDAGKVKQDSGFTSANSVSLYPYVKRGDLILAPSAVAAACFVYADAQNDGVPLRSPSNTDLGITGTCLADGTDIYLDQDSANQLNVYGIVTAVNLNGFKLWGNYTNAYPASGDVKDIWISVRRMFNWTSNSFILNYLRRVDDPLNIRLIEDIVDSENMRLAAYVPGAWAAASVEYAAEDNPTEDILAGKLKLRISIAPYTPAQVIEGVISYDVDGLMSSLNPE